jgi:hypothetical protein
MKIEDIRSLVTLIEQSKNESLKKILTDYLASQLVKENMILPDSPWVYNKGCKVCGIGADGSPMGYVCNRSDCPTRITVY